MVAYALFVCCCCVIILHSAVGLCPDGIVELPSTLEKQILSVHPSSHPETNSSSRCRETKAHSRDAQGCEWQCLWEIQSSSQHSGLVIQILDLDVDDDAGNFLEIRECEEESCPETCGLEFDPEEDVDCHQWCDESGPEEEFHTEESCVRVELILSDLSGRGLLLSYTSTINEVVVVSPARLKLTHYILISVSGLTGLVMILIIILIWTNQQTRFKPYQRKKNPRIIFVTPATAEIMKRAVQEVIVKEVAVEQHHPDM